ncbi:hypothetical protein EI94DRAFT_1733227 [Lactarius quietus]|nr:hypothetical protein EI94DRAFT_1733227 [Lactarius quietus]
MADTGDGDQDRYIHLKEISVDFIKKRPTSDLELVFKDDAGVKRKSNKFKQGDLIHWNLDVYIRTHASATLIIRRLLFRITIAEILVKFGPNEFGDGRVVGLEDSHHRVTVNFVCGRSLADDVAPLGSQACTSLASNVPTFWNPPELTAPSIPPLTYERFGGSQSCSSLVSIVPTNWRGSQSSISLASSVPSFLISPLRTASSLLLPTPERGYDVLYAAIHRLNDDILLDIFNCYRLEDEYDWNDRFGWCKLSHVCQRWRHLIYESTFHLGMHIRCTNGTPIVDTLDHLPPLPLLVDYRYPVTKKDELGIYNTLRMHDRVRDIRLHSSPSILHKCFVLMDKHFPKLEHLDLSVFSTADDITTFTLPKAFLAPNLRYLELPGVSPPRRLRMLTSTVSLVTLVLRDIQTSGYFRPRLLVARLSSIPRLEELSIYFSTPIPRPSTERELLVQQGTPVTLPNLKTLRFQGVGAYLECLVGQIRAPFLERLDITLFNQIAFALPHLSYLVNITEAFKRPKVRVHFRHDRVFITTSHHNSRWYDGPFRLSVVCKQLDWQIDCAAQVCSALFIAQFGVERVTLDFYDRSLPAEWEIGEIDVTTWHELLRPFIGMKELNIQDALSKELSHALQLDEVGSDPGFLPELQHISAVDNLFTSFIDTRRAMGRPVQFSQWPPADPLS